MEIASGKAPFEAIARKRLPWKVAGTAVSVRVAELTPEKVELFDKSAKVAPPSIERCHLIAGAGGPTATTVKDAFAPTPTVVLIGFLSRLRSTSPQLSAFRC